MIKLIGPGTIFFLTIMRKDGKGKRFQNAALNP